MSGGHAKLHREAHRRAVFQPGDIGAQQRESLSNRASFLPAAPRAALAPWPSTNELGVVVGGELLVQRQGRSAGCPSRRRKRRFHAVLPGPPGFQLFGLGLGGGEGGARGQARSTHQFRAGGIRGRNCCCTTKRKISSEPTKGAHVTSSRSCGSARTIPPEREALVESGIVNSAMAWGSACGRCFGLGSSLLAEVRE